MAFKTVCVWSVYTLKTAILCRDKTGKHGKTKMGEKARNCIRTIEVEFLQYRRCD